MRKSFTLIELVVTVGILIIIAGASIPALFYHQKRAKLEETTTQIKDAILSAQNLAFAPGDVSVKVYSIYFNLGGPGPRQFGIYQTVQDSGPVPVPGSTVSNLPGANILTITPSATIQDSSNVNILYRVSDKAVGFNDNNQFNDTVPLEITLSQGGQTRIIRIQNMTGAVSVETP